MPPCARVTFDSFTFVVFFAVVLVVDRALSSARARKAHLLGASALFYAAWNPPFVLLVALSTIVDYVVMHRIARSDDARARRAWLLCSLAVNLSLLGFFKYGGFVVENSERALAALGVSLQFAAPDIVLPVGISFYTFQTLSTTIDVYRRRIAPTASLLDYALFVTFFPQLVAGPIVRGSALLPQIDAMPRASGALVRHGLALVVVGLAMKVALADAFFAPVADVVFAEGARPSTALAYAGVLAFSGQIFCDFAGYSTCAIGSALALGFALPDNFRAPYAARGLSDFWRRWHITLSSWLRDYLYVPLGGSRGGAFATARNLAITMLLGGLWHGAAWTFVAWGAIHGAALVVEHALLRAGPLVRLLAGVRGPSRALLSLVGALATLVVVVIAWVPFRAPSFEAARAVLSAMFFAPAVDARAAALTDAIPVALFALLVVWQHATRDTSLEQIFARLPRAARALVVALLALTVVFSSGEDRAFLYFQF